MPKETDRLKLPLPLGNESVTRESINGIFEKIDAGVATREDLDTLREAMSQMDIPDASLTQKGKVQLSNKADGTSETVAATEKAVRDARVAAETNAKSYTDTVSIKKASTINASSNLNSYTTEGEYFCAANTTSETLLNCPVQVAFHLKVEKHAGVVQKLTTYHPNSLLIYQRNFYNGSWGIWEQIPSRTEFENLKLSVSDGKASIAAAITGKGIEALGSDTFSVLVSKINRIFTGGSTAWINGPSIVGFVPSTIETTKIVTGIIPGFKTALYLQSSSNTATSVRSDGGGVSGGYSSAYIVLRDTKGRTITLASASSMISGNPSWCFVNANIIAISPGKVNVNSLGYYPGYYNGNDLVHTYVPSSSSVDFSHEEPIEVVTILNKTLAGYTGDKYQVMSASISLKYTYQ